MAGKKVLNVNLLRINRKQDGVARHVKTDTGTKFDYRHDDNVLALDFICHDDIAGNKGRLVKAELDIGRFCDMLPTEVEERLRDHLLGRAGIEIGWMIQDKTATGWACDSPIDGWCYTTLLPHAKVWDTQAEAEKILKEHYSTTEYRAEVIPVLK